MAEPLTTELIFRMIAHWLATKPNTYYGSDYGAPLDDLLQKPLSSPIVDAFLAKMRKDIPVIAALPSGMINMWWDSDGLDKKFIYIEVAGQMVSLEDLGAVSRGNF